MDRPPKEKKRKIKAFIKHTGVGQVGTTLSRHLAANPDAQDALWHQGKASCACNEMHL